MNEIRDLIIGIDFGKETSQICYYDRRAGEARSLSMKVGSSQYEAPTCICKRVDHGDYCVGLEAEYFAREKGGVMIEPLYEICEKTDKISVEEQEMEPWEIFSYFLKGMLKFLGVMDVVKNTRCLVITVPSLSGIQVENFQRACEHLGFSKEKYLLMDYGESFYYYVLGQKQETWNRSVAWYAFSGNRVEFCRLAMNGSVSPVLVQFQEPEETQLSEEPEARDLEFLSFVKRTLGSELYSSIQITGDGFSQEWSRQSVKMLCFQKRKVFYGNNLFAKGACMAAKEKLEDRNLKGYRYLSQSLVTKNVGMDMRVMGAPAYHPLIEAGNNWYESSGHCELILDKTEELIFSIQDMTGSEKRRVAMSLPGLPKRPNKTTRLSLDLQYISPKQCRVTVKDLGFGDLFPGSGKVWSETVEW